MESCTTTARQPGASTASARTQSSGCAARCRVTTTATRGISATATDQELVWGLAVGCGVNQKHMAFAYGRNFAKKPIISCGVVIDGEPHIEYMNLGSKVRRI